MREQILDSAQLFVQTRGFHAFSYADIAAEVGIRKASIHYYFPAKTDLGREIVARYREEVRRQCRQIRSATPEADQTLQRYAQVFRDMLRSGPDTQGVRVCLCGALVSEWHALSGEMREEVAGFFRENADWLAAVLDVGRSEGCLHFEGSSFLQAQAFLSGLEGAMQTARVYQDVTLYCAIAHQLLGQMGFHTFDLNALLSEPLPLGESSLFASGPAR